MRRYMLMNFCLLFLVMVLAGCKSVLHPVEANPQLIAKVTVGTTTKDDILNTFGSPDQKFQGLDPTIQSSSTGSPSDIAETWVYVYTSPVSSVPAASLAVGMFTGSTTRTTARVTYSFDKSGIVRSVQPIYY
jgi:outer membrane protein assembly factor BamE (lipoprotein component of BamABCDE complex)